LLKRLGPSDGSIYYDAPDGSSFYDNGVDSMLYTPPPGSGKKTILKPYSRLRYLSRTSEICKNGRDTGERARVRVDSEDPRGRVSRRK
jgi:hypothetical protein